MPTINIIIILSSMHTCTYVLSHRQLTGIQLLTNVHGEPSMFSG